MGRSVARCRSMDRKKVDICTEQARAGGGTSSSGLRDRTGYFLAGR